MAEVPKLLYIVVVDNGGEEGKKNLSYRYTRPVLQSTLQLMGCKARHASKISQRVFDVVKDEYSSCSLPLCETISVACKISSYEEREFRTNEGLQKVDETNYLNQENFDAYSGMPFELYKRLTTISVPRECFLDIVCDALALYKYVGPNQRADLLLACRIRERKQSVTVLLCGTSGCGKSTLSALLVITENLLGGRLGVTTVISTDSIRHMMRSYTDEKQNALLWASTYHAGECLDPVAVAEAKAKRKARKLSKISHKKVKEETCEVASNQKLDGRPHDVVIGTEIIGQKQMAVEGFKAQSEMVIDSLDRLITAWEERNESVVVEGVHLSLNFVMGLMKKHPSIVPFMIYISNEEKHMERFAVRAKYMTLDPARNRYVKYIRNIRAIQDYLCARADKHLVPKINNTNVDRSVAAIHATIFGCLRRQAAGEKLYDPTTNTVAAIRGEYRDQCAANVLSSKRMFQLIQSTGSSSHLMALLNVDGSVAKAWPVESVDFCGKSPYRNGIERWVGSPRYGPLQIGKAEPVNLQFGHFGISAWPKDSCGTSHTGSIDDFRADGTDTGSRYFSSCCSSPNAFDGPSKERTEDIFVAESDEEAEEPPDEDSDEDFSGIDHREIDDEIEGSVDEDLSKWDDECEDMALLDELESGYCSDDESFNIKEIPGNKTQIYSASADEYQENLELFLGERGVGSSRSYTLFPGRSKGGDKRVKRRSLNSWEFESRLATPA